MPDSLLTPAPGEDHEARGARDGPGGGGEMDVHASSLAVAYATNQNSAKPAADQASSAADRPSSIQRAGRSAGA